MENCPRCNKKLERGCTVHNVPANCQEQLTFPYMEIGEAMHIECYIQKVIEECVKEKLEIQ